MNLHPASEFPASRSSRGQSILAVSAMLIGVVAVYCPLDLLFGDAALYGMDFWALHLRRIEFVREHLSLFALPAWYPRELLGTPFWSNLQNFPWIPTRLVLLLVDPRVAYGLGVNLAAVLAASFTYLYGRSIGWGPTAAALAGWTFACSGFFAARVMVGHLPLLEVYPALPLLLWLIERTPHAEARSGPLAALALGTACVVVGGHPQLPAYAVASALLYLLWIRRGRRLFESIAAMVLGGGMTLAVWWPMLELLQRSTRVLPLAQARNDLALPYSRLAALFIPWKDGWPSAVQRTPPEPFTGFPSSAYFWDTFAYVGILPWLAALGLLIVLLSSRKRPRPRAAYFATMGLASLLFALPVAQQLGSSIPGTILRSPARLLYLTTFALSLAVGAALDAFLRSGRLQRANLRVFLAGAVVLIHVADLASHDFPFIRTRPRMLREMPDTEKLLVEHLGSGRVAIDYNLTPEINRRFDDVGFFDSIILARPYRALLALGGKPPDTNVQSFSGSALSARALSNLGAQFVVSGRTRSDLTHVGSEPYHVYWVPWAISRSAFFPPDRVRFLNEEDMDSQLRQDDYDLGREIMLPIAVEGTQKLGEAAASKDPELEIEIEYERPSPDRISVQLEAPSSGVVRVLESWDPGWRASLDGAPVPVLRSDTFAIAAAVDSGRHRIEFHYETPGARFGAAASLVSLLLLASLLWTSQRRSKAASASMGTA